MPLPVLSKKKNVKERNYAIIHNACNCIKIIEVVLH